MVSPQHGDQTLRHLSTGSWLSGVWLHGGRTLLRLLLGVGRLGDGRRRPHQPDFIAALEHPSHTDVQGHVGAGPCSVTECRGRHGLSPSVFRGGSGHVVELDFPANALLVGLHGDHFAGEPLLVDAYFNQQTLIWWQLRDSFISELYFSRCVSHIKAQQAVISPFWAFLVSFSGSCWGFGGFSFFSFFTGTFKNK